MYIDLSGKTALITGGGTGIGKAISIAMARCGANVAINYSRSKMEAEQVAKEIKSTGGKAICIKSDITNEMQTIKLVSQVVNEFGSLDILIANAGGPGIKVATSELSSAQWDEGMDLNCKGVFYCVKHSIPKLSRNGGRIIITSSISARSGAAPGMIAYAAAKGAINNMVRNWAKEFAVNGITVNAIAPGVIRTRIHEQGTPAHEYAKLIERIPLGRDGQPEDCVGVVLLLAGREGSYITGQIIEINGGMQMP
jgi:3-oxoacyl-[acyl-carrier protein] reductase